MFEFPQYHLGVKGQTDMTIMKDRFCSYKL